MSVCVCVDVGVWVGVDGCVGGWVGGFADDHRILKFTTN